MDGKIGVRVLPLSVALVGLVMVASCGSSDSAAPATTSPDGYTADTYDAQLPDGYEQPPDVTTTAIPEPDVSTVGLKWTYVDKDGWHYEGTIDARLPKLAFSSDVSEAPPGRTRLMVEPTSSAEQIQETVTPVDEGRQGPELTLERGLMVYPLSAEIERFDGMHSGLDGRYFGPCMHAYNEYYPFAGFEAGYLVCNPSEGRVTLGMSAMLPMPHTGEREPALPYDDDQVTLEAALPGLDNTPGYLIRNPASGSCPDFLLVDGKRIVQQGGFSEESLAACTFTVGLAQ
jgi:hypothetical protein